MTDWLDDFIDPLLRLGYSSRGDLAEIASALAEDAPDVTRHQLGEAVKTLRRTWRFMTFPNIAACLEAIRSSPRQPLEELRHCTDRPASRSAVAGEPPILRRARAVIAEWEVSDDRRRAAIGQARYDNARRLVDLYASSAPVA